MKTYEVEITSTQTWRYITEIEADSEKEAEYMAREFAVESSSEEMGQPDWDHYAEIVRVVKEEKNDQSDVEG